MVAAPTASLGSAIFGVPWSQCRHEAPPEASRSPAPGMGIHPGRLRGAVPAGAAGHPVPADRAVYPFHGVRLGASPAAKDQGALSSDCDAVRPRPGARRPLAAPRQGLRGHGWPRLKPALEWDSLIDGLETGVSTPVQEQRTTNN